MSDTARFAIDVSPQGDGRELYGIFLVLIAVGGDVILGHGHFTLLLGLVRLLKLCK